MKTTTFKLPSQPSEKILSIMGFEGIDLSKAPTEISQYASPDMMNFSVINGAIEKRTGRIKCFDTALTGTINIVFDYRKPDGTTVKLLACETGLYSWEEGSQPTLLYNSLSGNIMTFVMNSKLYILDGSKYLQYDGTSFIDVTTIAYIPTLFVAAPPAGGGNPLEQWNLIGRGFKQSFSSDGTALAYQLSLTNLDADKVTVWINGEQHKEDDPSPIFTVDRTNGKINFSTAPVKGTDNVVIQAYKTYADLPGRIFKCNLYALFGGLNDTRVILSGNPDSKSVIFRSGIYDPTYFPENTYQSVGNNNEAITGLALQYDSLIVLKENSIWTMDFELNSDGTATYPVRPLNDSTGCIAPKSVQLLDNSIVFLDKKGVFRLVQSSVRTEKNVQLISEKVNVNLLKENLENAISIDYDGKYYLIINGNGYIMDYRNIDRNNKYIWWLWNSIPAICFYTGFYFGAADGFLYRLKSQDEPMPYNDDGAVIDCWWKSAQLNFGTNFRKKYIPKMEYRMRPYTRSSVSLSYNTEETYSGIIDTQPMDLLDFGDLDFSRTSFITSRYPQPVPYKIKAKKINIFQIKLENNTIDEACGIESIDIKFQIQGEVK